MYHGTPKLATLRESQTVPVGKLIVTLSAVDKMRNNLGPNQFNKATSRGELESLSLYAL